MRSQNRGEAAVKVSVGELVPGVNDCFIQAVEFPARGKPTFNTEFSVAFLRIMQRKTVPLTQTDRLAISLISAYSVASEFNH